jgi:hypothetical protein
VNIKTLTGKTVTVEVDDQKTIEELLQEVKDELYATGRGNLLLFAGKKLEEGRTLADYNIVDDSTIHFVKRLG